jgi:hypothetical protein
MTWSSEVDRLVTDPAWEYRDQIAEDEFIEFIESEGWREFESIALEDPGEGR